MPHARLLSSHVFSQLLNHLRQPPPDRPYLLPSPLNIATHLSSLLPLPTWHHRLHQSCTQFACSHPTLRCSVPATITMDKISCVEQCTHGAMMDIMCLSLKLNRDYLCKCQSFRRGSENSLEGLAVAFTQATTQGFQFLGVYQAQFLALDIIVVPGRT